MELSKRYPAAAVPLRLRQILARPSSCSSDRFQSHTQRFPAAARTALGAASHWRTNGLIGAQPEVRPLLNRQRSPTAARTALGATTHWMSASLEFSMSKRFPAAARKALGATTRWRTDGLTCAQQAFSAASLTELAAARIGFTPSASLLPQGQLSERRPLAHGRPHCRC
jgi:hypothetical protein